MHTWGDRKAPTEDYLFVLFPPRKADNAHALQFISEAKQKVCGVEGGGAGGG